MEHLWSRFICFTKESYTRRFKENFGGVCMGFFGSQHLLFGPDLAHLVSGAWWIMKGIGTVMLAFFSGLATTYGSKIVEEHFKKKVHRMPPENKRKKNSA